jgi:hypothetical protein
VDGELQASNRGRRRRRRGVVVVGAGGGAVATATEYSADGYSTAIVTMKVKAATAARIRVARPGGTAGVSCPPASWPPSLDVCSRENQPDRIADAGGGQVISNLTWLGEKRRNLCTRQLHLGPIRSRPDRPRRPRQGHLALPAQNGSL